MRFSQQGSIVILRFVKMPTESATSLLNEVISQKYPQGLPLELNSGSLGPYPIKPELKSL